MTDLKELSKKIYNWYLIKQRSLPWREDRDPYKIWVSEIMLQQTGVSTVLPYFENFINKFPSLEDLAKASENQVVSNWAGLGYYSRARNIHKAAKLFLIEGKIPDNYKELLNYPGIGPYTSRAISSIAFDEPVGVIDGNVIRVLSRLLRSSKPWWKQQNKNELQKFADQLNQQGFAPNQINQALMELGATVCTPRKPKCEQCPWKKHCQAFADNVVDNYPIAKPKQWKQIWLWQTKVVKNKNKYLLIKSATTPFLKNHWLLPFSAKMITTKPDEFDFKHSVTKYNIFVQINNNLSIESFDSDNYEKLWLDYDQIIKYSHSSMTRKIFNKVKS